MKSSAGFSRVAGGTPVLKAGLVCSSVETSLIAAEITGSRVLTGGSDGV
jgi:enoyl reductase-like protein